MFSSRTPRTLDSNPLSSLLEDKRRAGAEVLDLTEANPTTAGFAYPETEILRAFESRRALLYEPTPLGLASARESVAAYYEQAFGVTVNPEQVVLTPGSSEAYAWVFKLLTNPGDRVLVPRPSYPLFEHLAALESIYLDSYEMRHDGAWYLDIGTIESALNARTKALVIVNPNNPTGNFLKRDELAAILDLCARHNIALVSDEVFGEYAWSEDDGSRIATVAGLEDALTFALGGLSKSCGLPQMKLGWIAASGPPSLLDEALERLAVIADAYLSVSTPVQLAAPVLLGERSVVQQQIRDRVHENRNIARDCLGDGGETPCSILAAEGGWYLTLRVPDTQSDEAWALELLAEDDVYVHPGYFFDFADGAYLVVSLLTPPETFRAGLLRLLRRVVVGAAR